MKPKIGRNARCPCGSGKKYKKCCMGKDISHLLPDPPLKLSPTVPVNSITPTLQQFSNSMNPNQGNARQLSASERLLFELKSEFEKYNQVEIISALGGLQVFPENQTQLIRLEVSTRIACSYNNNRTKKINSHRLKDILNHKMPANGSIGRQEDPPEDIFTDNLIFYGGNHVVYTGMSHNEVFILNNFIETIIFNENRFPSDFVKTIKAMSSFLLIMINEVAHRMGHPRYIDGQNRHGQKIKIPKKKNLTILQKSVVFTEKEIKDLIKPIGLDYELIFKDIIRFFCSHPGDESFDEILNSNPPWESNPLLIRPLVKVGNSFVMAIPGSIATALRHRIIVNSADLTITTILAEMYREHVWKKIERYLKIMSFKEIDLSLPSWDWEVFIKEGIFSIDTDKIAYIQLITDDLSEYDINAPHSMFEIDNLEKKLIERYEAVAEALISNSTLNCRQVLIITVFGETGRNTHFGISKLPNNAKVVLMNVEELNVIVSTHECDNLTLWKYNNAYDKLSKTARIVSFSFLDNYAYYIENNHSFYTDKKYDSIHIPSDMGTPLRIKTKKMWDKHAALHYNNNYLPVLRLNADESIPIYFIERGSQFFELLVEGYKQPIWVKSNQENNEIPAVIKKIYLEFSETIAYWLWQITPNFKHHLESLKPLPITVTFDLEDHESWNKPNDSYPDQIILDFKKEIDSYGIKITIPSDIIVHLSCYDNEGERIIIDELMQAFGKLLENKGAPNNLDEAERRHIIDINAPLGIKKKITILNQDIVPLDPQNLVKLRIIQEHDKEEQLDGLVNELGNKAPPVGEILNKKDKTQLCNNIVSFYNDKLTKMLSKYNQKLLLEKLLEYNESVHYERASQAILIGPSIECYSDIQSRVENDVKKISDLESTALSLRSFIEKIVAEPPTGDQELSLDEFDQMLAIMYHIVNWAMLSDDIHLDLYDIKMCILENGRVGVDKTPVKDIWDPFRKIKTLENTESAIKSFKSYFKDYKDFDQSNIEEKIENAFEAEFGFDFTKLNDFFSILISIAYEQDATVVTVHVSELKDILKSELMLNDSEVDNIVELFSLKSRDEWLGAPTGFNNIDVWPWRYNRRLSYLRRPILISPDPEEDPVIFWGPKHVYETGRNLISLVMSGRFKGESEEMKSFIGDIVRERGHEFTKNAKKWLEENTSLEIYDEVSIAPGKQLDSEEDIGDVDIIAIDKDKNLIFSIECKYTNFARNPREVNHEIEYIMEDNNKEDSWITKHSKRDIWLKHNIKKLKTAFGLSSSSYQVFSVILTAHEIPTTYIHDLEIPFLSFTALNRDGLKKLYELVNVEN